MLPRFYLSKIEPTNDLLLITNKSLIHQITKVLRLKKNDVFIVFSSRAEYEVILINTNNNKVQVTILEKRITHREPEKALTLYQSLLKKDKFEWILQKGVELGVRTFIPIISDNSIVREISTNKQKRYHKIIQEATEQCGGQNLPGLEQALTYEKAIENIKSARGQKILAWEGENEKKLAQIINISENEYHLFIGPEGGFSLTEIELARKNGLTIISLGNRILRAETAAIATTSLILLGQ